MATPSFFRRPRTYLIGIPLVVILAVVVGPFLYIHFIQADPPKRLSLDTPVTTARSSTSTASDGSTSAGSTSVDGTWKVTSASTVGYRVNEVLFGQRSTAVGRSTAVTGELVLSGSTASKATFTADLTRVSSDEDRRDQQFQGRIMDTATHPNATFALEAPIELSGIPADGVKVSVEATGDLTLKGTTRSVTFTISARRNGDKIEATGSIPITFADYGIDNPSGGPATTEDHGELEFLVVFARAT